MKKLIAISIRQPFAEQILRGIKKNEFRPVPTAITGPVYVYASLRPRTDVPWRGVPSNAPRGMIIGTVEITGCRKRARGGYAYALKSPRPMRPVSPKAHPQPIWFYPFGIPTRRRK